jgi:signal transduction histidine kinase
VYENTSDIISKRQLSTLRNLGAQAVTTLTVAEACQYTIEALADNAHDLPFAALYLLDEQQAVLKRHTSTRIPEESLLATPEIALALAEASAASPWLARVAQVGRTGETCLEFSLDSLQGALADALPPWQQKPRLAVILPLMGAASSSGVLGVLVAGVSPRRALDESYVSFFKVAARQISSILAAAKSFEAEKKRVEALAALDKAKTLFFSNIRSEDFLILVLFFSFVFLVFGLSLLVCVLQILMLDFSSHEFRTPLTLMLGPLEDLLSDKDINKNVHNSVSLAHRNATRLQRLVNTLLDFSRIEAGRMQANFRPTDLNSLTVSLASMFQSACDNAGLYLRVSCDSVAGPHYVDEDMWEKILLNLLSNAFKYTLRGGISVTLRDLNEGAEVELRVTDTGCGIAPQDLPRLFERFLRLPTTQARSHEGTGIGLALVYELVRLHGGSVRVESAGPGAGSSFTVTLRRGFQHLPAAQVQHTPLHTPSLAVRSSVVLPEDTSLLHGTPVTEPIELSPPCSPLDLSMSQDSVTNTRRPGRILVVDDNADMREYVAKILLSCQHQVMTAADGREAYAALRSGAVQPELIVSDVMMPRLDGFGLLKLLRAEKQFQEIPFVFLSARAGEESSVEGLEVCILRLVRCCPGLSERGGLYFYSFKSLPSSSPDFVGRRGRLCDQAIHSKGPAGACQLSFGDLPPAHDFQEARTGPPAAGRARDKVERSIPSYAES